MVRWVVPRFRYASPGVANNLVPPALREESNREGQEGRMHQECGPYREVDAKW